MVYSIHIFKLRQACILVLLSILLLTGCADKEKMEPYCEISFAVKTDTFFRGCIIPISIKAGEGLNSKTQVQLFINDENIGLVPTSPEKYYWKTENIPAGIQTIRAIYTSLENGTVTDEKEINLLSISINCPSEIVDIDGNSYPVIQIGNQCWMQKNLQTTHYTNGETLISGLDSLHPNAPTELPGWYFAYQNNADNVASYGYLYTWSTAMKGNKATDENSGSIQGICPDGWHMPDVHEWNTLIDFVGGVDIAANKLKDTTSLFWTNNLDKTDNASDFTALPGGFRNWGGSYLEKKTGAYFWTATETIPNHAYHIYLRNSDSKSFVLGHQDSKRFGYSVRCVKD